ncbi:MAG: protocatechuate 3,4-dioxygenase subunit alpha [Boseongicola sp.]|nr:MAG: protocatechuate 3,4-dioxygenase subunit alpha [Boseongicola sp.]
MPFDPSLRTKPATSNATEPLKESPSQTAGPYVHIGCVPQAIGLDNAPKQLASNADVPPGESIVIQGRVLDGEGALAKDVMIESWQIDGQWHRAICDLETGQFRLETSRPQATAPATPSVQIWIVARGINIGLSTRIYFDDEENSEDPILALVPDDRRNTLIAKGNNGEYQIDIRLQGDDETVFFDA